jgi:hypothetical protein
MTLCVAATCRDDQDNRCIVLASDWKTEVGAYAGAEIQNKLYWLWNNAWPTLIAGTASDALDMIATFRSSFNRKGITEENARDRIMEALLAHKEKFTKEYVRAHTNLTFDYFRDNKDKVDPSVWSTVWKNIGRIKADCNLILCSFAAGIPLMFQVSGDFSIMPEERLVIPEENFLTIGTGSVIANSMLCFRGQNGDLPLHQTVYNVFEAMRFAHKASAPGVGRHHAFSVLSTTKNGRIVAKGLRQKGKNFFKDQYNLLGPKEFPETMEVPNGIWRKY